MSFEEHFHEELANPSTKYFILDTGDGKHGDVDYERYEWSRSRFNKLESGHVFLYRRPKNSSETGEFYFFGAGKIGSIEGDNLVNARVIQPYPFQNHVHQRDLLNFHWQFKDRGNNWANFFPNTG